MSWIEESVNEILTAEGEAIAEQAKVVDAKVVEQIVELFLNCKGKVFITGCGTSGAAAKKAAHTLSCVNRPAVYLNPADAVHGGLGVVAENDIVVFLSKGGATPEITRLASLCREKKAITIAVCEKGDSPLTAVCDIWLKVKVNKEPDKFNMLATASTLAVIAVMDVITICVMYKNGFTKEDFALIHPGGAVGERLLKEVNI